MSPTGRETHMDGVCDQVSRKAGTWLSSLHNAHTLSFLNMEMYLFNFDWLGISQVYFSKNPSYYDLYLYTKEMMFYGTCFQKCYSVAHKHYNSIDELSTTVIHFNVIHLKWFFISS